MYLLAWKPSFVRKLNFLNKSQPTQLRTFKLSLEYFRGSYEFFNQDLKRIKGLTSYDRTKKQTDRQKLQLYILYKYNT